MSRITRLFASLLGREVPSVNEESSRRAIRRRTQLRLVRHCDQVKRIVSRTK